MTVVETGRRTRARKGERRSDYCQSCEARMRFGEPRGHDTWPQKLTLDQNGVNVLLIAAAEFMELHALFVERAKQYGLPIPSEPTAVDFVDWAAPSLLPKVPDYDHEGSPNRDRTGQGFDRHPFPVPQASDGSRRTRGRAA